MGFRHQLTTPGGLEEKFVGTLKYAVKSFNRSTPYDLEPGVDNFFKTETQLAMRQVQAPALLFKSRVLRAFVDVIQQQSSDLCLVPRIGMWPVWNRMIRILGSDDGSADGEHATQIHYHSPDTIMNTIINPQTKPLLHKLHIIRSTFQLGSTRLEFRSHQRSPMVHIHHLTRDSYSKFPIRGRVPLLSHRLLSKPIRMVELCSFKCRPKRPTDIVRELRTGTRFQSR